METGLDLQNEKVMEVGGGDGYTTMRLYLVPLNRIHLEIVKMVHFLLHIF